MRIKRNIDWFRRRVLGSVMVSTTGGAQMFRLQLSCGHQVYHYPRGRSYAPKFTRCGICLAISQNGGRPIPPPTTPAEIRIAQGGPVMAAATDACALDQPS